MSSDSIGAAVNAPMSSGGTISQALAKMIFEERAQSRMSAVPIPLLRDRPEIRLAAFREQYL
jgi:hypothetical protein